MDLPDKAELVRGSRPFSSEEKEVFSVIQKFMQGIAQKAKLLLDESLDDDAKIDLRWQPKGEIVGKEKYIQIITADRAALYRSDFQFFDVIIEIQGNLALAKGIFMFQGEPFSSSLLWIKLVKKRGKWLVASVVFPRLEVLP